MEAWVIEKQGMHQILIHYCESARASDGTDVLRQDIGGGYVRCERCGAKYLPVEEPGNPRLILRLKLFEQTVYGVN